MQMKGAIDNPQPGGSMQNKPTAVKSRGAADNPPNRFERLSYVPDLDALTSEEDLPSPRTIFLRDPPGKVERRPLALPHERRRALR
jgi:hypothetical protein